MQFWNWFFLATAILTTAKPSKQYIVSECIALLTNIMRSLLPPYANIRCHTLMACALDDWYEAEVIRFSTASFTLHNVESNEIVVDAL